MYKTHIVSVVGSLKGIDPNSEVDKVIRNVIKKLIVYGFIFRTSGSSGIEMAVLQELKYKMNKGLLLPNHLQLYLPWNGYNTSIPYPECYTTVNVHNYNRAFKFARVVCPSAVKETKHTKLFHAKNALVVFGKQLNTPSDILIAYVEKDFKGKVKGKDASAVLLAEAKGIPVINLYGISVKEFLSQLSLVVRGLGYPVYAQERAKAKEQVLEIV